MTRVERSPRGASLTQVVLQRFCGFACSDLESKLVLAGCERRARELMSLKFRVRAIYGTGVCVCYTRVRALPEYRSRNTLVPLVL